LGGGRLYLRRDELDDVYLYLGVWEWEEFLDGKIMVEMKDENIIPNEMTFLLALSFSQLLSSYCASAPPIALIL
jgi:hypothetical protein